MLRSSQNRSPSLRYPYTPLQFKLRFLALFSTDLEAILPAISLASAISSRAISYAGKPRERNSGEIFRRDGQKMRRKNVRPSISRKGGRKKFHEKLATNSAGREIKFFHRETLGVWGHKILGDFKSRRLQSFAIWASKCTRETDGI